MYLQKIKLILLVIASLSAMCVSSAVPDHTQGEIVEISEDQLRDNINSRGDRIQECYDGESIIKKKKDDLLKLLNTQVDDLFTLVNFLDERVDSLDSCVKNKPELDYSIWPLPLLSEDISVFKVERIKDSAGTVPPVLKKHYEVVCLITNIASLLEETDKQIEETIDFASKNNFSKNDQNDLIQKTIENNVQTLLDLFTQLKKNNTDSFSEEQIKYIESLKERYNKYSQYYE